jgi:hypothetical protein
LVFLFLVVIICTNLLSSLKAETISSFWTIKTTGINSS